MTRAYVAVGSNLGNREQYLTRARQMIEETAGVSITAVSPVYETDPVGGPPQGKFLNAVWAVETVLEPGKFLKLLLSIEEKLGRTRREKNSPRTLDLDLLFYGDQRIVEDGLSVPHPRLHERRFVLQPMVDLAPDWVHPRLKKTVRVLLEESIERNSKP
jgi:2-amino-4-hydroxy-6-hydroxymethyldihydropteridine diphosphokinase